MKILKNVMAYLASMAALVSLAIPLMVPVAVNAQTASSGFCYTFSSNLGESRYLSSQDAAALTTALTNAGVWSGGAITTYNDSVASAVSGFQEKYASQILAPYGLSYGTGFIGVSTRSELNSLYGCSAPTQPVQSTQCPAGYTCTPINQNPAPVCPAGYTCTPITTNPTQPVNPSQASISYVQTVGSNKTNNSIWSSAPAVVIGQGFTPNSTVTVWIGDDTIPGQVNANGTQVSFNAPSLTGTYGLYVATSMTGGFINSQTNTVNVTLYWPTCSNSSSGCSPTPISSSASASLSLDAATPQTQSVNVTNTTQGQYLSLPVMTFDVNAQGVSENLTGLTVQVLQKTGQGSVNAAYLYQGSTLVSSAAVNSNGSATFSNIQGVNLQANMYTPFTIRVDVSGLTSSGSSEVVQASVSSSQVTLQSNGSSVAVNGSAMGNAITVTNGNPTSTGASASLSLDAASPTIGSVNVTNTTMGSYLGLPVSVFDVNAQGANLHLHSLTVFVSNMSTTNINASGSGVITAAYLYQGSTLISSSATLSVGTGGSGQVVTFNNIPDNTAGASISNGVTMPYTIKVDVTGMTSGTSEVIEAAISQYNLIVYNPSDSTVPVSGSANGNPITVTNGSSPASTNGSANVQLDASTPVTGSINVTNITSGTYLGLLAMNFDVFAQGTNLHLHQVSVNIANTGGGSINAAYLFNGSTEISSAAVVNGVATFSNITDGTYGATISANTNTVYSIKVDVSGLTTGVAPAIITASVQSAGGGLTIYNAYDSLVSVSGGANGNAITVVQ